jgi:hypothetical protein
MDMNKNEINDGITTGLKVRKQRGLEIAALAKVEKQCDKGIYLVPSQHGPVPRGTPYVATQQEGQI